MNKKQSISKVWNDCKSHFSEVIARTFTKTILFLTVSWVITDALWTIISVFDYYNQTTSLDHSNWLWVLIVLVPIALAIVYFYLVHRLNKQKRQIEQDGEYILQSNEIIRFHRNIIDSCFNEIYLTRKEVLEEDIKKAVSNKDWKQAIKIGKYGARLFLMLACYDLRIKYGDYIIKAATEIKDVDSIAIGYIDCKGWSYVKLGDYDKAETYIKQGLDEITDSYSRESIIMRCKAYRHLAGIKLKQQDLNGVNIYKCLYESHISKLHGKDRKIMEGSLDILNGDILVLKKDYEKAKVQYRDAAKLLLSCNEYERAIKVYSRLGAVDEKMGQLPKALKNYMIGYWRSDELSRVDEKLINCEGICRLFTRDNGLFSKVSQDMQFQKTLTDEGAHWEKDQQYYFVECEKIRKSMSQTSEVE